MHHGSYSSNVTKAEWKNSIFSKLGSHVIVNSLLIRGIITISYRVFLFRVNARSCFYLGRLWMHYSSVHAGHKIRSVMLQTLIGHLKNTVENVFPKCQVNFVVAVGVLKRMKALE